MKKTKMIIFVIFLFFASIFCFLKFSASFASHANDYKYSLIDKSDTPPLIDGTEIGPGRNDGVQRIYSSSSWHSHKIYEYSFNNGNWSSQIILKAKSFCSTPIIADLKQEKINTLFLGSWRNLGVLMLRNTKKWSEPISLPMSIGKGNILSLKAADGRNDGVTRLYVAYWSHSGLIEYSQNGNTYELRQLLNKSIGRFAVGRGRNDDVNRIYAVERGGFDLHEFTWTGNEFADNIVFTGSAQSNGSVYVGDGRGDQKNRVYVWAGGLFELTYEDGSWSSLTIEKENHERYYINAGSIRSDKKPSIYVSVKKKGLHEYTWSETLNEYKVDVISGATGGCVIGDGRGDGKNRLYVGSGTKGNFTKAAIVEIWQEEKK